MSTTWTDRPCPSSTGCTRHQARLVHDGSSVEYDASLFVHNGQHSATGDVERRKHNLHHRAKCLNPAHGLSAGNMFLHLQAYRTGAPGRRKCHTFWGGCQGGKIMVTTGVVALILSVNRTGIDRG